MNKPFKAERMAHGEAKQRYSITLTPTAWEALHERAIATEDGLSRSELVERIARGLIPSDRKAQLLGELPAN